MTATMPPDHILPQTFGHVVLRRLATSDLPRFHAYRSDPQVGRFQGWSLMSQDEASAFIKAVAVMPLFVPGEWLQLGLADRTDDQLLGDIGLFISDDGSWAEIGFTLHPDATGQGHATTAVRGTIAWVFGHTRVQKMIAITDTRNRTSARVLERVGMSVVAQRTAVFRDEACSEWVYEVNR
jgi:[ribosomal protein S5]-alanine N-acetyltransferase